MAKTADQFVDDLLAGKLDEQQALLQTSGINAVEEFLKNEYDSDPEAIRQAILNSREKLEAAIGTPLTDEQLVALAGGKSAAQKETGQVVGAGIGGAVGAVVLFWIIK